MRSPLVRLVVLGLLALLLATGAWVLVAHAKDQHCVAAGAADPMGLAPGTDPRSACHGALNTVHRAMLATAGVLVLAVVVAAAAAARWRRRHARDGS